MDQQDHLLISPVQLKINIALSLQGDEVEVAKVRVILVQRRQGNMCSISLTNKRPILIYDLLFFLQIQEQFRQRWSKGRELSNTPCLTR